MSISLAQAYFSFCIRLRPISSAHLLQKGGQGYARRKLWGANREFSSYFRDRGFDWDDFESTPETETILYYIERKAKEIEESGEPLDRDERNIVRIILYLMCDFFRLIPDHLAEEVDAPVAD